MKPLVSICIPAYNNAAFIRATVESALAQTYENLEVLVIDDCSSDNTAEIISSIQDSRLRLIRNETNLGMTGNWNKCIEEARGEFVKLLCGDDILYPNSIALEAQALIAYPSVVLATSDTRLIDIEGNITGAYRRWFKKGLMNGKKAGENLPHAEQLQRRALQLPVPQRGRRQSRRF